MSMSNSLKPHILKFLNQNYPISRVKHNKKFKRGIVMDGGVVYLLSHDLSFKSLVFKLLETVIKVFECDKETAICVVKEFLHLDK